MKSIHEYNRVNSEPGGLRLPKRRAARSAKSYVVLSLLVCALAFGTSCFRNEPGARTMRTPAEPRIEILENESELIEELMGFDCVGMYRFSGMLLEVWLEAIVQVPGKEAKSVKGLPLAIPHFRWDDGDKPRADNTIGQLAVWGGEGANARQQLNQSLRIGVVSENQAVSGMGWGKSDVKNTHSRQFAPALVVPWPEGLPKSYGASHGSSGISSLIPRPLPPVGEAFPVFRYHILDRYQNSPGEELDLGDPPDLEVTVKLMARRLPFQSPRPHADEIEAVTALRNRGFLVCQEGSESREYEGNDGGRATRVYGGLHDVKGSAEPSDDDMRQIATLDGCQEIDLWRANLTDQGLLHLADLQHLTSLEIRFGDEASITSDGMRAISRMHSLEHLWLEGTTVTDEAVPHLKQLTNLKRLYIYRGGNLSADALEQLELALPQATIRCR